MAKFEGMLKKHPEHPFVLIHLGQLTPAEAGHLIAAHGNVYFITSHSNPAAISKSRQPWTNMFSNGAELGSAWRALIIRHPDRFVLGFDNVFSDHWGLFFVDQVRLWRGALEKLPHAVAHAIAHENAERLWRLERAEYVKPAFSRRRP